ncbi:hypothetical protein LJR255_000417 [Pararhizobium sp. LjRoot255]
MAGNFVFSAFLSTGNRAAVNFYGRNKIGMRHLSSKEQPHSLLTGHQRRQRQLLMNG